ncbi:MAG TPA: bifunctional UDP-sugar hydrolase/5'-nucleotidase [Bdellovibrionota bacterium]|nr:bifunctional UDP-sugar hydrolase/5'-nucleotidase [Bdellovibrionota bacterium]
MKSRVLPGVLLATLLMLGIAGCVRDEGPPGAIQGESRSGDRTPDSSERLITILQTNDIHGNVDSQTTNSGDAQGGMAFFGGVVRSIREGLAKSFGRNAGVLVVDAGDQFQGTLLSNYGEGQVVYAAMNQVGYDAGIPGNHAFDFGPIGWLEDQVTSGTADQNPKGALYRLLRQSNFPLLSANTYARESLVDLNGEKIVVNGIGCKPTDESRILDWSRASQPDFIRPYVLREVADLRVAIIGLDNIQTPQTTTSANVADICFRDQVESYLETRKVLEGKADVFVAVIHDGNSDNEASATKFAEQLVPAGGTPLVDAVIAGHTHYKNSLSVKGVPIVQSGGNGKMFGRIDLVWNQARKALDRKKTRFYGGIPLLHQSCPREAKDFCTEDGSGEVAYQGVTVQPDASIQETVASAKRGLDQMAKRKLGIAEGKLWVDRVKESPLANLMTDTLRGLSGAEIAFINTGGLRTAMLKGNVTYENLFSILPFNNRGVVVGPMPVAKLLGLLLRSVQTCGKYGALMQSGLRVVFEHHCPKDVDVDLNARLLRVETVSGEVLFDAESGERAPATREFTVATLDFLSSGGSGWEHFKGIPVIRDLGVLREVLTEHFIKEGGGETRFRAKVDGRWSELSTENGGGRRAIRR